MIIDEEFDDRMLNMFSREHFMSLINDIKQNGIDPKSKLFWALIPKHMNYVAKGYRYRNDDYYESDDWVVFLEKPTFFHDEGWMAWVDDHNGNPMRCRGGDIGLKINYTSDWKYSLHYRGDYE